MPIAPGSILVTSLFTSDSTVGTADDSFSFIATENIDAGTVIRFWDSDTSPNFFDYTVGVGGLSAGDRVTIGNDSDTDTASLVNDPSSGSISALQGLGSSFTLSTSNPLVATTDIMGTQQVIAGIASNAAWDANFSDLAGQGVSRSELDAFMGSPSPVFSNVFVDGITGPASATNIMFAGTNISGYGDSTNWVGIAGNIDHTNPNIGGVTYATQDTNIVVCFAAGTLIATPSGETAVENVQAGDLILTSDGRSVPVKWLWRQTVRKAFAKERAQLVRIGAGTLGNHSDLCVTGDHGMVLEGCIINASALVNGTTIDWVPLHETPEVQVVYHIETDHHDTIIANGAPSESYLDVVTRRAFDNYAEYADALGSDDVIAECPLPRVSSQRLLPAHIRAQVSAAKVA